MWFYIAILPNKIIEFKNYSNLVHNFICFVNAVPIRVKFTFIYKLIERCKGHEKDNLFNEPKVLEDCS
jgi:hypothetical protein